PKEDLDNRKIHSQSVIIQATPDGQASSGRTANRPTEDVNRSWTSRRARLVHLRLSFLRFSPYRYLRSGLYNGTNNTPAPLPTSELRI
ncbi:MAG TPA: hypothetical protein VF020_10465, partial [Chthoniobacterales bacterium]